MTAIDVFLISLIVFLIFVVLFFAFKIKNVEVKTSQDTLIKLTEKLTELKGATQSVLEIGKSIQSLQDILKSPKLRGGFGEVLLEQSLLEVLPSKCYQTFYRFQTGDIVDAVVRLKDSQMLCIDAKFPLDSLKNYIASSDNGSGDVPSQFIRDVKKHIDSISAKYILPREGTLDFALMYIPAESVYYEIILKDDKIARYAREKHVIPVSPNSLYSYLSTILIGLKGMEVEKNTRQILDQINSLRMDLNNFIDEFNTLGVHLNNARTKYEVSSKLFNNVSHKLKDIEITKDA